MTLTNESVIVTGAIGDDETVATLAGPIVLRATGNSDLWMAELDAVNGSIARASKLSNGAEVSVASVVASDSELWITGSFKNGNLEVSNGTDRLDLLGHTDVFVARLSGTDWSALLSARFGGPRTETYWDDTAGTLACLPALNKLFLSVSGNDLWTTSADEGFEWTITDSNSPQ
jgi:hypothetical protein